MTLTPCSMSALAAQENSRDFSLFFSGPGVAAFSSGDEYSEYQWALNNTGRLRRTEKVLNIKTLDHIYLHYGENGIDDIALPPLGPDNFESINTDAVANIDINIEDAWKTYSETENKRTVTVAIIDTGIDTTHSDLKDSIWVNEDEIPGDGIDNDGNGFVDDVNGWNFYSNTNQVYEGPEDVHGTHAAGTIAASKDNGGIVGIADNNYVKIMPVKALGGEEGKGSPDNVIAAIKYAEANGAQNCTEEFKAAIRDSGMLFIVAAGNGDDNAIGYNIDASPIYPASLPFDNVITVANLMFDGKLDESSNFGAGSVDIAAPGTFILGITPDNGYAFMSGTSMAAPMVTATAAMLYTSRPELSLTDIKNVILASARKMDSLNGKVLSGGMLDANGAMQWGRQ